MWHFLGNALLPTLIAPIPYRVKERGILLPAGKIPAATQQQSLFDGILEAMVRLFAIAVLMAAVRIGRFRLDAVVAHQRLVVAREHFRVAVGMDRQRHPVRAMPPRSAAQNPERVLQAFAQTGKALGEADGHMLPVRVGQHEVVDQVIEALSLEGHPEVVHVGEVR